MANKNRIKVVLADKQRTNEWLAEQLGKEKKNNIKVVHQLQSTRLGEPA